MTAPAPTGRIRPFFAGVGDLGRGFAYWRRLPRAMALGLIPAGIVGAVLLAGLITLAVFLHDLVDALTRFADDWSELGASLIRLGIGAAIMGGAIVLAIVSFTALTLVVGDPFYERIWRAVEADLGGPAPTSEDGFWRSVGDSIGLILRGLLAAVLAFLLGLIPVVGGVVAAVAAAFLTGWLLADELTSRALTARGLDAAARRRLRRSHRARVLGFGVATQLCFLIPLGAVVAMPAAVAGSTRLARHLQEGDATIRHAEAGDRGSAAQNGA